MAAFIRRQTPWIPWWVIKTNGIWNLAAQLQSWMNAGKSRIAFAIGGSLGHGQEVLRRADFRLSFGKPTFSHQIFRIMLLEQIYRAFKILHGEPYHK